MGRTGMGTECTTLLSGKPSTLVALLLLAHDKDRLELSPQQD